MFNRLINPKSYRDWMGLTSWIETLRRVVSKLHPQIQLLSLNIPSMEIPDGMAVDASMLVELVEQLGLADMEEGTLAPYR
jgi:hypothetical protein